MQLCPVCGGEAEPTVRLEARVILERLGEEFGEPAPLGLGIGDYSLRQCGPCSLVYADPMVPGSAAFYRWVARFPQYHAQERWEWGVLRRILQGRGPTRLLELGCGEGRFLASLVNLKHVEAEGLDFSDAGVARACARGVKARSMPLEDAAHLDERFDVIVMSHVLEHVEGPLRTLQICMGLLNPGGEILFSVPYSPTSRELRAFDIMNLPPHHLTRWNMASLQRLAEMAKLQFKFEMRKPKSLFKRALRHAAEAVAPKRGLVRVLSYPAAFADGLYQHGAREKVAGRRAADEILVRLTA